MQKVEFGGKRVKEEDTKIPRGRSFWIEEQQDRDVWCF